MAAGQNPNGTHFSAEFTGEPIHWRYLPYMFGLFLKPNFQGISPQNMAKNYGTFTYLHFRILKFPLNIPLRSLAEFRSAHWISSRCQVLDFLHLEISSSVRSFTQSGGAAMCTAEAQTLRLDAFGIWFSFPGFSVAQNMGSTFRKENKRHVSKKNVWKMNFLLNLAKNMNSWRRLVSRRDVPAPKDGTPGFGPMAHGIFMTTPGLGTCLEGWLTDGFPPFAITNILRLDG